MQISQQLTMKELHTLIEHLTSTVKPDPMFMRSHVSALMAAIESWADEIEEEEGKKPKSPH